MVFNNLMCCIIVADFAFGLASVISSFAHTSFSYSVNACTRKKFIDRNV